MLTHFAVGPTEDQTYQVAYMVPGTRTASIVYEHLNEKAATEEAERLNARQRVAVERAAAISSGRHRISNDLTGA